jgi:hypothetical protein
MRAIEDQDFNDDLLLTEQDREKAAGRFGDLVHVLEFPELQAVFEEYNKKADRAKKARRRSGFAAIVLSVLALFGISAEPVYYSLHAGCKCEQTGIGDVAAVGGGAESSLARPLGLMLAGRGLAGALIGFFGIWNKKYKQRWLCNRLMTERLRQFHFQTLVCQIPAILAFTEGSLCLEEIFSVRRQWLSGFLLDYEGHLPGHLQTVLDDDAEENFWLLGGPPQLLLDRYDPKIEHIFDAYRLLRLQHQLQYANYKLYADEKILPRSSVRQRDLLSAISIGAILIIVAIHLGIAVSLGFGSPFADNPFMHVGVVWVAIAALTARALEEGLQPSREVERYIRYRATLVRLLGEYDQDPHPQSRISIMYETERAVYKEMRRFLKINEETRFAL